MTITKEQLAEWQRMTEAATEGPWRLMWDYTRYGCPIFMKDGDSSAPKDWAEADRGFIATAREAVPALLAEVERLQGDLQRLGAGCKVRKVDIEWPALAGRIDRADKEGMS